MEGREGRRGEGGKAGMGVDQTKFGKKSMSVFIGLYYFEYKNNRPIASHLQRIQESRAAARKPRDAASVLFG